MGPSFTELVKRRGGASAGGNWSWRSAETVPADEGCGEQECGAEVVDGSDAEGVGEQSTKQQGQQAAGLPEHVEAGEDPAPDPFGCLGLEQGVEGDGAGGGAYPVSDECGQGGDQAGRGGQDGVDRGAQNEGAEDVAGPSRLSVSLASSSGPAAAPMPMAPSSSP